MVVLNDEEGVEVDEERQVDRGQNRQADRQSIVIYMLIKVYSIYNEFKTFYLKSVVEAIF